jgi:hypothetical protein
MESFAKNAELNKEQSQIKEKQKKSQSFPQ